MGRSVEQGTDPSMGSEIGATIRLAGPAGIGDARRLVEIDGKPYLLLDREVRPVDTRKPFRRTPVAASVAFRSSSASNRALMAATMILPTNAAVAVPTPAWPAASRGRTVHVPALSRHP